ncbi:hypothetical protein KR018_009524, partial [Drosophila ironensis]
NSSAVTTPQQLDQSKGVPDFEYTLLGKDPKDQHWYRVSLTSKSKSNHTGYWAQFATRKHPPFDEEIAHRHDKTIKDLLDWLDRSEDQSLWRVYRDLLEKPPQAQSAKEFENDNKIETDGFQVPRKDSYPELVVDKKTRATTSTKRPVTEHSSNTPNNLFYYVKSLK